MGVPKFVKQGLGIKAQGWGFSRVTALGKAKEQKGRILQMLPNEIKKLVLSMDELNRQRLHGGICAGLGTQGKQRGHPLPSVGLPPDGKEPVR